VGSVIAVQVPGRHCFRCCWVILRTCSGPTSRTSFGSTEIVCEEVPAPPGTVLGAEERRMTREVAKVLAPAGWGQKKLLLARWGQTDFSGWGRNRLLETLLGDRPMRR